MVLPCPNLSYLITCKFSVQPWLYGHYSGQLLLGARLPIRGARRACVLGPKELMPPPPLYLLFLIFIFCHLIAVFILRANEVVIILQSPSSPAHPLLPPPSPAVSTSLSTVVINLMVLYLSLSPHRRFHINGVQDSMYQAPWRSVENTGARQAYIACICALPLFRSCTLICILYSSTPSEKLGWLSFIREFEAPVISSHLACGFREEEGGDGEVVVK